MVTCIGTHDLFQATSPLVEYYGKKGVVETFRGTQSDVIYPQVKRWLEEKTGEY